MRRLLPFVLKGAISALLLYLAVDFVNFGTLRERFTRLDPAWLTAGFICLMLQLYFVSLRWRRVAGACGATASDNEMFRFNLIGMFFNQALPSTIGGDAARVWLLARKTGNWKSSVYSVLVDRAAGLMWLALLVMSGLPWSLGLIKNPIGRTTLILIGAGGVVGPIVLFALTFANNAWLQRWRVTRHLADLARIAWNVLVSIRLGPVAGVLSVSVHVLTVAAAWCAAKAIGSPLSAIDALLLIPPVILIAAIPLSIAGWGVREGAMIAAFTYAGLSDGDGLLVSLLLGAGSFAMGAFGGLAWIVSGDRVRIESLQIDEPAPHVE